MRPRLRSLAPTAIVLIASSLLVDRAARAQSHIHTPEASAKAEELSWLHISGQLRERGTYLSAIEYDNAAEAAGWFWTQRAVLSADVQATSSLRGRVTLQSALIQGGEEDAPIERNDLDVQEAFVELGPKSADLRLGRQEIRLGSQRLVAVRDGTNVRRAFDGARLQVDREEWRFDAFALRLVDVDVDGVFNDGRDEGQNLVGVYVTAPARFGEIDLYYLYTEFDDRPVIEGRRDERRHSVGARAFGERQGWFWDWEAIYQFGAFDRNDIRAWTAAANTGYRWENVSWRPEIMLSTNIASGDSDPNDGRFETFNALYPRGSYFSENALLGPANFFNVHPYVRVRPRDRLLVVVDVNFYWRLETEDGVYSPPGLLIREPLGSNERFVDISLSGGVEWEATENMFASILYTRSEPQAFIRDTGPTDPVDFVELTLDFRF